MSTKRILLLPHLNIQNANALSSPYTIGFPAMTAWLGAVHALQRKFNQTEFEDIKFSAVGVVCHKLDLQTYKGQGDFVHSIIGTGNPLVEKKKRKKGEPWENFERPPFIEEARCHLDVTLIVECEGINPFTQDQQLEAINCYLNSGLKFASGDLLSFGAPEILTVDDETTQRKLTRRLMPGYVLIERRELMIEAMQDGQDALDALLDSLTIKYRSEVDETGNVIWTSQRKQQGWIIPIATGFHGITPLVAAGETKNQRDPDTSHRFAESIVTLGEFVMPYRIDNLADMLWSYQFDEENNLYLCRQQSAIN